MSAANVGSTSPIRNMVLMDHVANVFQQAAVTQITRSGSVATAKSPKHGFATGDSVTVSGTGQAEYNITATITVSDEDTFTYTVSGTPVSPATITASGGILATCANNSRVAPGCSAIQVEPPAAGTTLKIEKKVHRSAQWVQEGSDITNVTTAAQGYVAFAVAPAFVRVRRSAGTGACKAFAQTVSI